MQLKKLTPGEITQVVEKIRRRYEEYIFKYFKSRSLKSAFEDRYMQAIKAGVDISSFLMAEISAVEELIRREVEKIVSGIGQAEPKKESFSAKVDRMLEERLQRIRRYPQASFHKDADEELKRLLGAMSELEQKRWEDMCRALGDTAYSRYSVTMVNLETKLRELASLGSDGAPASLSRYIYHLNLFPRNYQALDREEKQYILEAAFFLHDVNEILERALTNYPQLEEKAREALSEVKTYLQGIIEDFRLKDLKRKK